MDAPASPLKRPADSTEDNGADVPRKRQSRGAQSTITDTPPAAKQTRRPRQKRNKDLSWKDIPKVWSHDKSLFLDLPIELLDKIVGPIGNLDLQDHLALAGTCRMVRKAYTEEVWMALLLPYTRDATTSHIFSNVPNVLQDSGNQTPVQHALPPDHYLQKVVAHVNEPRMTKTDALQTYRISDNELAPLKFSEKPNPYRRTAPMKLYRTAQLRALSFRIHGGPLGHKVHMQKSTQKSEKIKATREKNGTASKRKGLRINLAYGYFAEYYEGEDTYDDEYGGYFEDY